MEPITDEELSARQDERYLRCSELERENDRLRGDVVKLRSAIVTMLKAVDEAYVKTGYFRVAKTSVERLAIEAALKATEPKEPTP